MTRTATHRNWPFPRRVVALAWLLLSAIFPIESFAQAGDAVDRVIVRYRDSAGAADSYERLATQLGTGIRATEWTRDGAIVVTLQEALAIDHARAAINRVRMDASVLYAGLAPRPDAVTPVDVDSVSPPTNRLIVRFAGPALREAARAGTPPGAADLDRMAAVAGIALAFKRYMHDGAMVLGMVQRLPVSLVERIAARIAALPDVDFAQPDYIDRIALVPDDTCYPAGAASLAACNNTYQWDLFDPVAGINAPAAWDVTTGTAGIRVSVVDTGALFNHPDLAGRFVGGFDMILDAVVANDSDPALPPSCSTNPLGPGCNSRDANAADPGDWITAAENASGWLAGCGTSSSSFHGTHVAGTIGAAGNNATGIAGINWASPIVPLRVLGKCGGYTSDIADAITWASGGSVPGAPANVDVARVLNLSLSGYRSNQTCDSAYGTAISGAMSRGSVVVVAAGNNNWNSAWNAPANCAGVVTVAATGQKGFKAYYSNYGAQVEIAGPGGDMRVNAVTSPNGYGIVSTLNNGTQSPNPAGYNYRAYQGTSMASPHVAGVASLMFSVNPALTPSQVAAKLQAAARPFPTGANACDLGNTPSTPISSGSWFACNCTTALCGAGLLDAFRAVLVSQSGGVPTTTGVTSSQNPSALGAPITFTATVAGIVPTGTVTFNDGASPVCTSVSLTGTGDSRTAACSTSALATGTHSITAVYGGDANNAASTSPSLEQVVEPSGVVPTTTALASSVNPTVFGQLTTFTATVTPSTATGSVTFRDGAAPLGTIALASGVAALSTSALAAGSHSITAAYGGDPGHSSSTSGPLTQVVNQAPAITSANNVTFTVGTAGNFMVTATGFPAPTFTRSGALPTGVNFNTATGQLSGTPAAGTGGVYPLTIGAINGVPPDASQNFTLSVNVAPTSCTYSLSPLDLSNVAAGGGARNVTVTTQTGCPVTAQSFQPWVAVVSVTPGSGTSVVALNIAANGGGPRATSIRIADRLFLVTQ